MSVIIPTLAWSERAERLQRALEAVLTQDGVRVIPIVVVNGPDRDPEVVRRLRADRRFRTVAIEETGIPAALHTGRQLVDTPLFAELDDDDILLPGALAYRSRELAARPDLEAVVTNGIRRDQTGDTLHVPDPDQVRRDGLMSLLSANWLLPGSWLCRTDALGAEDFAKMPRHLECTYLAVLFARRGRMAFLDQPTVVWHTDDPHSESKSLQFHLGQVDALRRILDLDLPRRFRRGIRRKMAEASHSIADRFLQEGRPEDAWDWHLRSLRHEGGWRYLLASRHWLKPMLSRDAT